MIFITHPAFAADSSVNLIKSVIQQQLDAFNDDDYDTAYQFASKHIQSVFTQTEFETMVRTGFPQIAKSRKASFDEITLSDEGSFADAIVHVTGVDRVTVIARYKMVMEEGKWKNNGVIILGNTPLPRTIAYPIPKSL